MIAKWMKDVGDPWIAEGQDHSPDAGSDLALDDTIAPKTTPVAHHGIVTALDHLGSVVDAMTTGSPMRHYAHFTVLRTALLASARTRWLLAPDDSPSRQLRCVQIRFQNLDEQRKAVKGLGGAHIEAPLEQARQVHIAAMNAEEKTLQARALALGAGSLNVPLDTVSMLRGMVEADTYEGTAITQMWRTGSAAAHGYYWTDEHRHDPGHFDEQSFNLALYGAMFFINEAMKLYTWRAASPDRRGDVLPPD